MILSLNIALQSLNNNKTRTVLTVIGVIIGIAAVIIVMSAGEGLKGLMLGQLDSFGSNIIQIETKVPSAGKNSSGNAISQAQGVQITSLKIEDGEAIAKIPNVKAYYGAIFDQENVTYQEQTKSVMVFGITSGFLDVDRSKVKTGRFFSAEENNEQAKVATIGPKLVTQLFGNEDPIGRMVKVGKSQFRIIGVMEERGGGMGIDYDSMLYVPAKTAQKVLMGIDHLLWITVSLYDKSKEDDTAQQISYLLQDRHQIIDPNKEDFSVTTMTEAKAMIDTIFNGITLLLIALAGISLLVGGVGIMNIMYVSVTERTFEIGLRKAVGAQRKLILWQFLLEAVIITLLGGAGGIIVGVGAAYLISLIAGLFGFSWQFVLPPSSIAIAFGFCAGVGLIFGYYPARHAANLDPISALRHE